MTSDKNLKKQIKSVFSEAALAATQKTVADDEQIDALFSDSKPAPEPSPSTAGQAARNKGARPAQPPSDQPRTKGSQASKAGPDSPRQPLTRKQSEWANDPLIRMAADKDPNIARLALSTLKDMGEAVRRRILGLAQQPTAPLHAGIIAYLNELLGLPVVYVPPGRFTMGSDADRDGLADSDEQPQHELALGGYWIARYPVTVAQFRAFVGNSGYQPAGNEWASDADDYPVVDVTWHDAMRYCRWQAAQSSLPVTLPSEAEWEKAARGTDGRIYPWGSYPPTSAMCGFQRGAVGAYSPQGDSVYGCADMAGNVWEWTRSAYRPYPYRPDRGREDIDLSQPRVVRGVTYGDVTRYARCACRYNLKQNTRLLTLGFRVVVTPR